MIYSYRMEEQSAKRPLWQWVLLAVLLGGFIVVAGYYMTVERKNGNFFESFASPETTEESASPIPTPPPESGT